MRVHVVFAVWSWIRSPAASFVLAAIMLIDAKLRPVQSKTFESTFEDATYASDEIRTPYGAVSRLLSRS
jgi:hypothetical protein